MEAMSMANDVRIKSALLPVFSSRTSQLSKLVNLLKRWQAVMTSRWTGAISFHFVQRHTPSARLSCLIKYRPWAFSNYPRMKQRWSENMKHLANSSEEETYFSCTHQEQCLRIVLPGVVFRCWRHHLLIPLTFKTATESYFISKRNE